MFTDKKWQSRTFIMANIWGVVYTTLLVKSFLPAEMYVTLMGIVFAAFCWKSLGELKLNKVSL